MESTYNPFEHLNQRLTRIEDSLDRISSSIKSQDHSEVKYYNISDAAKKLNLAEITLYRGVKAGKYPSKKVGTRVLIPGSFVDRI
jgi:excisionase family DNA binding protein